jgi:hypothetical protein
MTNYIPATTGQLVQIIVQTVDGYGDRYDDGYSPTIQSVYFPDLSVAAGYPTLMTRLSTGLYIHGIQLPTGYDAVGTYIVNAFWQENSINKWEAFAISANRPFGNVSISPG